MSEELGTDPLEQPSGNFYQDLAQSLESEKQKRKYESIKLDEFLDKYPPEERHTIGNFGGMEIVACEPGVTIEHMQILQNGFERIKQRIGDTAEHIFDGLKIYIGKIPGGGQALARENAVILDLDKMDVTVGQMEEMLSKTGEYRAGDQSSLVGPDALASELGFVHELGHILEYRAHGDMDIGFAELSLDEAPTEYGSRKAREDYAESWMYYIYGGDLDSQRLHIIQNDVELISKH